MFILLLAVLVLPGPVQASDETARVAPAAGVVSYVNIRAGPTIEAEIIGELHPGNTAPLVSEHGQWFAIETSAGVTGYVSRRYTETLLAAGPPQPEVELAEEVPPPPDAPQPDVDGRDRSVLEEASALLAQDRNQDAYELLSGIEAQWAGDSGFDYLYGLAALDSGHEGDALFALERVTRASPEFPGARLELARTLYAVGDLERARIEFSALLDEEPPENVRALIRGYLDAIDAAMEYRRDAREFYVAATGGYDTNANGAADIDTFGVVTLDPQSREQDSTFIEARLGGRFRQLPRPNVAIEWQGQLRHRHNPDADFVDQSFAIARTGIVFSKGANAWLAGLTAYWSALDGSFHERGAAVDLGWERELASERILQLSIRGGPVRFETDQSARDVDRIIYSLTLRQPMQGGAGQLSWTVLGGRDNADGGSSFSNTRFGGAVAGVWNVAGNYLSADLGFFKIPYSGDSNLFDSDRDDEQIIAGVALNMDDKPIRRWSFNPFLRYVRNQSNVAIYDYDRVEIGVQFRKSRR